MNNVVCKPIGIVHSSHKQPKGTPKQPTEAKGVPATVEIYDEYVKGLKDLNEFSYAYLLFYFHLSKQTDLLVKPSMDDKKHGVFSTRSPNRPNHIGLSIVKINKIINNTLYIEDVDIVDGTPIIDIKPYVADIDVRKPEKTGWIKNDSEKSPYAKHYNFVTAL